jgi:hypothetical protein
LAQEHSAVSTAKPKLIQPTDRRAQSPAAASTPIVTRILAECRHSAAALFFVSDFFADF